MKKGLRVLVTANMKLSFLCVAFFLAISLQSFGGPPTFFINIPSTTTVTQGFPSMWPFGNATAVNLPPGWSLQGGASPVWNNPTGGATTQSWTSGSANPTTGGTYAFSNTGNSDIAVGAMTSGGFASPNSLMAKYKNANANPITQITLSYNGKKFRTNTAAASVQFYYSLDGSTWLPVVAGNIAAATIGTGASAYNFTSPTVYAVPAFTISGLNILNADFIYLRWNINTTGSNSQAIAIDDVHVTAAFGAAAPPLSLSETHVDVACNGASTGSIDLTVTGGTAPFTYSWNSGTFTTQDLTGKPAGVYTVLVTDADGSTATTSVTLVQPAPLDAPIISADGPLTFCAPGSVTLTSSVASGNTWSTGSTDQSITVSTAGTYSVSYASGGCSSPSASAVVAVNTYGGSVTLLNEAVSSPPGAPLTVVNSYTGWTSASPVTFSSTDGVTDIRTTSASNNVGASGTANVFMGISGTINRNLTISGINTTGVSALSLSFGMLRDNTSNGLTVEVSADGSTYTSLSITQPASANTWTLVTATGTIPQTSNLRIRFSKNNNTSFRIDDIKLTGANTSASISQTNGCGGTVTLTASQGSSYVWSTTETTQSISVNSTGTYSVTVTSNGCASSASVEVNSLPTPLSASVTAQTEVSCFGGTTGTATVLASGGTAPYTGAGLITGLSAGTHTFVVTDANGCTTTTESITISQPSAIVATAVVTAPTCFGGTGNVEISATGGTGTLTGTGSHAVAAGASYSFTVTDENSCSSNTISGTMAAPAQVVASSTFTAILCNGNTSTVTVSAVGGTGSYGSTVGAFTAPAGAYSYTVTDGNNCSATTSGTITEPSAIALTETHSDVSCFGGNDGTIDLTVSGGTPIDAPVFISTVEIFNSLASTGTSSVVPSGWAFSELGGNTVYNTGTGSTATGDTYSFGAVSSSERAFGGVQSGSVTPFIGRSITNNSGSTVTAISISYFGEQWRLGNTGRTDRLDFQYSLNASSLTSGTWVDANALDFTATVTTAPTGALDGNANRIAISGTITGLSIPDGATVWIGWRDFDASGADDGLAVDDFSYTLIAPSAYTYLWSNTSTTQDVSALTAATYSVTVKDANNCEATTSVEVTEPTQLVATATITQALCHGEPASVEVTATGGTGAYTGTGTFLLADGETATYAVSDANSCSATSNSVTASSPSQIVATATITQAACYGEPASAEVTATGGTGAYSGTGTFSLADGESAIYVVGDANSCSAASNSVTASSPSQIVVTATITQALCYGGAASVEVTATGGTGAYSGTGTFSLADGESATYTVSDANSCSATSNSVTASSPAAIAAPTGDATQSFCVTLNPTVADLVATGSSVQWYANIGDVTPLNPSTGLVDGNHYFATQTVGTCESPTRLDVTVSISLAPELSAGCNATTCSGSSWTIDCSAASNYSSISWTTAGDGSFNDANALYPVYTPGSGDISSGSVDISRQVFGTAACASVSYSTDFNLTIEDCIFITGTTTSTICTGTSLGAVDITVSGTGVAPYTYAWSNGASSEDIENVSAGVYTVTVTDVNSATGSASFTVGTFTPPAKPAMPGTISGQALVCVGSSYTYSIAPVANAVSYIWTVPATASIVSGQGTTSVVVQFVTSSPSYTFNVAATNCIGTGLARNIIVTKIPVPARPGTISGTTPVCLGNTYTYSIAPVANATSYTWTAPANTTIISGQGTTSITLEIGATYTNAPLSVFASNCSGNSQAWQLAIVRTPAPSTPGTIAGPTAVCIGNTYTYSIAAVSAASSYTWTAPTNATILSGQGTTSITLEIGAGYTTGSLSVSASNCNATSGLRTLTISKTALPTTPGAITGPIMVCPEATQAYSIANVANATSYTWTAPANATIASGQGTTSVSISYLSGFVSGNVSVVAVNCSGSSVVARTLAVGLSAATPSVAGAVNGVCGGTSQNYSVATVNGATGYEWLVTGASSFTGQGTSSISVSFPASYSTVTIKVRATTSCSVAAWSTTITVRNVPAVPGTIIGPASVCTGNTYTYSIAAVAGATGYNWTLPSGDWTYVSGQGTTSYTVIAGSVAGAVKVNASNTCGSSVDATKNIAIATSGCGAAGKTDETADESPIVESNFNSEFKASAYPNPFINQFRLNIESASDETLEIRIFDVLGQLVQNTTKVTYQSDVTFGSSLSRGVYLLEVTQGSKTQVLRIVKSE